MAVNPNTPVLPTRATNNERGYINIDVQAADPNDPTPSGSSAKALGVFIAGVLDPTTGAINPAPSSSPTGGSMVQGNVASGTADSGNPVKVGAVYNITAPTYATGQRTDLQADNTGNIKITPYAGTSPLIFNGALTDAQSNTIVGNGVTPTRPAKWNGTTWDRDRKPNIKSRITSTAAGGSPTNVKTTAGDLVGFWGQNGAAITYLQIYDKASAPVVGTDTPIATYPIPANATFNQGISGGLYLANGVSYAFTTDAAGTTGAAAAAVTAFALFAA